MPSPFQSPTTGMSPGWPNSTQQVAVAPAAVAVDVEVPDAVAEDADVADAVAVPVAGHGDVVRRCRTGRRGRSGRRGACPGEVRFRVRQPIGGLLGIGRDVLVAAGRRAALCGIGQARLGRQRPGRRRPRPGRRCRCRSCRRRPSRRSPAGRRRCPSWAHRSPSSQTPLPLRSRNHWPSMNTPIFVVPSPFQSPVTGVRPQSRRRRSASASPSASARTHCELSRSGPRPGDGVEQHAGAVGDLVGPLQVVAGLTGVDHAQVPGVIHRLAPAAVPSASESRPPGSADRARPRATAPGSNAGTVKAEAVAAGGGGGGGGRLGGGGGGGTSSICTSLKLYYSAWSPALQANPQDRVAGGDRTSGPPGSWRRSSCPG